MLETVMHLAAEAKAIRQTESNFVRELDIVLSSQQQRQLASCCGLTR